MIYIKILGLVWYWRMVWVFDKAKPWQIWHANLEITLLYGEIRALSSSVKSAAESYCLDCNSLIFRSNIWNAVKCIGEISVWDCLEYIKVWKDAIFCLEKGLFSDRKALCKHPTDYWNLMNMLRMPLKKLSKPRLKW